MDACLNTKNVNRHRRRSLGYYGKTSSTAMAMIGLLLALHQHGRWIIPEALVWLLWPLAAGFMVWSISRFRLDPRTPHTQQKNALLILFSGLCLYLVSSATKAKWFYLMDWWVPTQGQRYPTLAVWAVFTFVLSFLVAWRPRIVRWLIPLILAAGMGICLAKLLHFTNGDALYRDDHPSFIFRIWLVLQTFPQMRNYIPMWNGGVLDIAWLSSGTHGIAVPWWPVFSSFPVHEVYTPVIGLTFAVLVPLMAVLSARILSIPWSYAAIAGCLSLGVSQHFFLWLLNYGTIGASLAMSFVVPVSALLLRSIWLRKSGWCVGLFLVLSITFLFNWQPGTIILATMIPGALLCWKRLSVRKIIFLAVCGIITLLLFLPTVLTLLFGESMTKFALAGNEDSARQVSVWTFEMLHNGWKHLCAHMVEMHPMLLVFGLVGLFGAAPRGVRLFYLPMCLILALLTGWGPGIMPNLQLSRMGIPLAFALVIPATATVYRLLRNECLSRSMMRASVLVLLAAGVWSTARIYGNEAKFRVNTIDSASTLIDWIKTAEPQSGRVMFAGSTVHGMGGGHVAYLPVLTGREMCAVDYYHFPPEMVPYEYPPAPFYENETVIKQFMEWHDVAHVLTHREPWKIFLAQHPETYELLHDEGGIVMYRVKREVSRWMEGSGGITAIPNQLDVTVNDPSSTAVIKYNWVPGLVVNSPAEIFPHVMAPTISFIGIRPNGVTNIQIRYKQ
jgi:hypothetical protein